MDIVIVSERKILIPTIQFSIHGHFIIYRFDRNDKEGGTMLNIKDKLTTFLRYILPVVGETLQENLR